MHVWIKSIDIVLLARPRLNILQNRSLEWWFSRSSHILKEEENYLGLALCAHFSTGHRLASDKGPRTPALRSPGIE